MNPRNLRNLLSSFSSSLFGPNICRRCCACSEVSPAWLHLRFSNTSSSGMFSKSTASFRTASRFPSFSAMATPL
uniref:Uncharacterized protein n=1 Tax=Arundo donax TaxID=35708 RepID=A0A0A9HAT3_ARUDO